MEDLYLTQEDIKHLNRISDFLAIQEDIPDKVDLIVLLGSCVLEPLPRIADWLKNEFSSHLLIVGGIGHSTKYLYENMAKHPIYKDIVNFEATEADLYSEILRRYFGISERRISIENTSTNCGNNASLSYITAIKNKLPHRSVLLVQDPTMQRRSDASFRKHWHDTEIKWYNWAPFKPVLKLGKRGEGVFEVPKQSPWTIDRYIRLVMGEIPRLRNDREGYGPRGKNFINEVIIPDSVIQAYDALSDRLTDALTSRGAINS